MTDARKPKYLGWSQVTITEGLHRGKSGRIVDAHEHADGWWYKVQIDPVNTIDAREQELDAKDESEATE